MNETNIIFDKSEWQEFATSLSYSIVVFITDKNTTQCCLPHILENYFPSEKVLTYELAVGEQNKTMAEVEKLWQWLLRVKADRNTLLVGVGGGMVTDITGFCASTYKRGVKTIFFPTTNLAMCDAAIGGKTGINYEGFKNQIGTFYLPLAVVVDSKFLDTLPSRHLSSGYFETVKHALIGDSKLWQNIITDNVSPSDANILTQSINVKLDVVAKDFGDTGLRQALNFGHTIGHAVEAQSNGFEEPWLHGESIAFGLVAEVWLSVKLCQLDRTILTDIIALVRKHGNLESLSGVDSIQCIEFMVQDKKNQNNQIICTLLESVENPVVGQAIDRQLLIESIEFTKTALSK